MAKSVVCRSGSLGRLDLVNLRTLELATEVNINGLPFRENIQHLSSCLTMAIAGRFCTAKRQVHFSTDRRGIHIKDAGVHFVHRFESAIDVLRVDGCRESITNTVSDLNRVFE